MYQNREHLATRRAHFFQKTAGIPPPFPSLAPYTAHCALACLSAGQPYYTTFLRPAPRLQPAAASGRRLFYPAHTVPAPAPAMRGRPPHPSGPASLFACVRQEGGTRSIRPMPCPRPPCGALRRIRPALLLSLPAFIKRAAPVPYGPCRARARHAGPPAASVRPCPSLRLYSPRGRRPFHTAPVSYAARACRANKGEGEGFPAPACATGGAHKTGPVCIMRYRHSALRMVI